MRILIVGPKWVGAWTESMGRAASALGQTPLLFHYQSDALGTLVSRTNRRLSPFMGRMLSLAVRQAKQVRDAWMNQRLIATAHRFQPDAIIVLKGDTLTLETLVALRSLNTPLVSWWVDDPFRYPAVVQNFDLYDVINVFDRECLTNLKARGYKHVEYLPCAYDPFTFYRQSLDPIMYPSLACTVGFVATYHLTRAELLNQLQGLDVGLWGAGWEGTPELAAFPVNTWRARRISAEMVAKVYNIACICPNVHHPQTRVGGLNMRTFEIPAAGGFEIVDNVPGLEESFEIGREIIAYSSLAHFRELADYYLSHPAERAAIAERGRARVLRDHTYEQRLRTILKTLSN